VRKVCLGACVHIGEMVQGWGRSWSVDPFIPYFGPKSPFIKLSNNVVCKSDKQS